MTTTAGQKTLHWHPHYDDESADVIFISNDKIRFGVSLKLLAKSSTVSAGMRSIPPPASEPNEQTQPTVEIDLECNSKPVLQFLELVSIHNPEPLVMQYDFEDCVSVLPLVEQYDCEKIHDYLRTQLYHAAGEEKRSWELFNLGADRDDWDMGRQGLKGMRHNIVRALLSTTTFKEVLQELDPTWQLALSSAILGNTFDHHRPAMDWSTLSSVFFDPTSLTDQEDAERDSGKGSSSPNHGPYDERKMLLTRFR